MTERMETYQTNRFFCNKMFDCIGTALAQSRPPFFLRISEYTSCKFKAVKFAVLENLYKHTHTHTHTHTHNSGAYITNYFLNIKGLVVVFLPIYTPFILIFHLLYPFSLE